MTTYQDATSTWTCIIGITLTGNPVRKFSDIKTGCVYAYYEAE